ncbi:MAG: triphosphoribosyl-dephospho-CoA synthase CitG [Oscillospiraceae bacterium]|nr:triphosphoribosyl-dephospho-CoA synthase CitG [Oscillospiraceae bacterium]
MEVTLAQVLQSREDRARGQQALLAAYGCPLICFTMNIAGPVKVTPLIERAFREGLSALDRRLPQNCVRCRRIMTPVTGCQAMYCAALPAAELKEICVSIEEATPLGRLFDMDVLDTDGTKLERKGERCCIVCGAPGRACAASRAHPVSQLQEATRRLIQAHFFPGDIGALAVQSLLDEANTTPKPGLVDRRNNGSHRDMDIGTFTASAHALGPYFRQCVQIGQETADAAPEQTFSLLRRAGLEAEKAMYRATGGVNTHKGAIYTMGILCGSLGRLWTPERPIAETERILSETARISRQAAQADFQNISGCPTAGERLYLERGLTGIRGEAAAGLPSVKEIGLPAYRRCLHRGLSPNDAGAVALLHLIAGVSDTNLYHRGGAEGARYAAEAAAALLSAPTIARLEALDDAFIARRLSPGGCADLLAATYFLDRLSKCPGDEESRFTHRII